MEKLESEDNYYENPLVIEEAPFLTHPYYISYSEQKKNKKKLICKE